MPFRFRKTFKITKGLKLNLSKSGISTSIGKKGASINIGKKGIRGTVGVPGTGISHTSNLTSTPITTSHKTTPAKPRRPFPWKIIGILLAGFFACIVFGMILQLLGY